MDLLTLVVIALGFIFFVTFIGMYFRISDNEEKIEGVWRTIIKYHEEAEYDMFREKYKDK